MIIGVLKEVNNDSRTSMLPMHIAKIKKLNCDVIIEKDAGLSAFATNENYIEEGCKIKSRKEILDEADIILSINPVPDVELKGIKPQQIIISVFQAFSKVELVNLLTENKITSFSMDAIPRISRAQDKDILSSMATVSGYKAVLDAAIHLPKFFPMFMTAAGTIKPAKVLIIGAGVAGLQAIATAKRLGAQVEAFDVRSAVKEQVESLGAKFIILEGATESKDAGGYAVEQTEEYKIKQKELVKQHSIKADVIITTAQIPGKKAPILVTSDTVHKMKGGSVIIDLAASTGGNCELTKNNETTIENGVIIVGKSDYPSEMPIDASLMYGNNLINFLKLIINEEGNLNLNWDDEVVEQTCITHDGKIYNNRVKSLFNN